MSPALTLLDAASFRHRDGTVVDVSLPTTKALDLLRLVAAGDRAYGTDHYIGVLWPRADEARGRSSLRTALAQLRRALGPEVVRRCGERLALGEVETDVVLLRRTQARVAELAAAGRDQEVLDTVLEADADLGLELAVSSGSCEEVYALRADLLDVRCQMMLDGAAAADRLGRVRECLDLARRADELVSSESTARMLMTAWAASGETGRAIEVFDRLRSALATAYGVQPSAQTRAVYLQLVTGDADFRGEAAEHHREAVGQVAARVRALAARTSPGGVVWVHGEPGAGRSGVARGAVRALEGTHPHVAARTLTLPELVGLEEERERLRGEAARHACVLVVPVRRLPRAPLCTDEAVVAVEPLGREDFHRLLAQLLQQEPTLALETRLWATTGGLAGHATRTVGGMLREKALRWAPGQVDGSPVVLRHPRERSARQVRRR